MNENFVIRSYAEGFAAIETFGHVIRHLAEQFRMDMTRAEAQANADARALLINRVNALLDEMELEYTYGGGGVRPKE